MRIEDRKGLMGSTSKPTAMTRGARDMEGVTIRRASADDERALVRLAQLDSQRPVGGEMLLAEMAGELRAAVPIAGGRAIADPFFPTASLVSLLTVRAAQVRRAEAGQATPSRWLSRAVRPA